MPWPPDPVWLVCPLGTPCEPAPIPFVDAAGFLSDPAPGLDAGPHSLSDLMNRWTLWALRASEHLVRLYRRLGDPRQAASASLAAGPCEERARRLGWAHYSSAPVAAPMQAEADEAKEEAQCWAFLVQAHVGVLAFHTVVDPSAGKARGLRGSRTATAKALSHALRGFRTAFPEAMAHPGIEWAVRSALTQFAEAFIAQAQVAAHADRLPLQRDLQAALLGSLLEDLPDLAFCESNHA